MRRCPKPIIAMVAGYAVGGGHILHMICDLTIAADNAIFGQTGPRVGSFDAGYGSSHMARLVGQKKVWVWGVLCGGSNIPIVQHRAVAPRFGDRSRIILTVSIHVTTITFTGAGNLVPLPALQRAGGSADGGACVNTLTR